MNKRNRLIKAVMVRAAFYLLPFAFCLLPCPSAVAQLPVFKGQPAYMGNGAAVVDPAGYDGADFSVKVNAAAASTICSTVGCIIDARGLSGSQSMSVDVAFSALTAPVTIKLSPGLNLARNGHSFTIGAGGRLIGSGSVGSSKTSIISGNDATTAVKGSATLPWSIEIAGVSILNSGTGTCVDMTAGGSGNVALSIHDNSFACATGVVFTGYYNRVRNNQFSGNATGSPLLWSGIYLRVCCSGSPNSNEINDNTYSGFGGTGVYIEGGYSNKVEGGDNPENIGLGYFAGGAATQIHGPYMEAVGCSVAWAQSTSYGVGAVIKDGNTHCEIATAAGTSKSGAEPAWSVTQWGSTADGGGGLTWHMYDAALVANGAAGYPAGNGIVIPPTMGTVTVDGSIGGGNYVLDLNAVANGACSNRVDEEGNLGWGTNGPAPCMRTAQPLHGFELGFWNSFESGSIASFRFPDFLLSGNPTAWYGPRIDSLGNYCTAYGQCGHTPLHVGTMVPASGIASYGPAVFNQLPTPAAPTYTIFGTPGSQVIDYYVAAHCGGGATPPSSNLHVTNAPNALNGSNYVLVIPPATFTGYAGYPDSWSMCTWDILKNNTSTRLAVGAWVPPTGYADQGGGTSAYTPVRNSTGDIVMIGGIHYDTEVAAPPNPLIGGQDVWWFDNGTHVLSCKTSTGANCAPGGGSMTWPAGGAGIPNYSGGSSWGTSYSAGNPIPASFLPNPTASTLGGIESLASVAHKWINTISTSGVPAATQPDFSDLTGSASCAQLPALTGDTTSSAGACADLNKAMHWTLTALTNASSPYSVVAADVVLVCNATSGAVVINLPAATGSGRMLNIKKTDSTANACTPTRNGSDTIDGLTSFGLTIQYASAAIVDTASGVWSRTHVSQLAGDVTGVSSANVVGALNGTNLAGLGTGGLKNTTGTGVPSIISLTRAIGYAFGDVATGSTLTTSEVGYVTVPFACTITGWRIMADAGTATIKTARIATGGTALPTIGSNSISTSGVALASGTLINSTTTSDFTSTAIAAGDTLGFFITAVATAKQITFQLDCTQ